LALFITFEGVATEEVAQVREELLTYCKMDTEGMVMIIKRLEEIIR